MTPEERVDANLDRVLKASGSALRNYSMASTLQAMRTAMGDIMKAEYLSGSNDCHKAYYKGKAVE